MDKQLSRRDLLSDLPLGIIHIILASVPIIDAVRTSLLSRQWRYIWTGLPHLAFDEKCVNPPMENEIDKDRLINFVSQSLLLHRGPIHKFQLLLPFMPTSNLQLQSINQWLLFLSTKDIRILFLECHYDYTGFMDLTSLYLCQNLTHLTLSIATFPSPPPFFKGFFFLKSLDICTLKVGSGTIESIVAHSPLLEELKLANTINSEETTIRSPNLKLFHCFHGSAPLSLYTPLLEEIIVDFIRTEHLSFHGSLVFHHLRTIKLSDVPFNRTEATMVVDHLLKRSPNLQKLKISNLHAMKYDAPELACVSFWDTESMPDFTYDSLKVIEIKLFSCGINEMKLIKFLLARSPVLERMMYRPRAIKIHQHVLSEAYSCLYEQVSQKLTAELLGCHRASASAEIVIDKKPEEF